MTLEVSIKELEAGLKKLVKIWGRDNVVKDLEVVAGQLIKRSIDSPIPSDTRQLANSGTVEREPGIQATVTFGFNRAYAAFQDAPGRSAPYVVRPKRKKFLYVPLNQAGTKHTTGANPRDEGLLIGRDYILAKSVTIPIKPYGSSLGPNHYFSETLQRDTDFAHKAVATRLRKRLGDNFKETR